MSRNAEEAAMAVKPFIPILQDARQRKVSEADTRTIIHKFLNNALEYDFIGDITKEFAIRGKGFPLEWAREGIRAPAYR